MMSQHSNVTHPARGLELLVSLKQRIDDALEVYNRVDAAHKMDLAKVPQPHIDTLDENDKALEESVMKLERLRFQMQCARTGTVEMDEEWHAYRDVSLKKIKRIILARRMRRMPVG